MLFGSIYQHFTFFANSYLFHLVVKSNAVQYRSPRCEKFHEIVMKMLRVEKVGAHATF